MQLAGLLGRRPAWDVLGGERGAGGGEQGGEVGPGGWFWEPEAQEEEVAPLSPAGSPSLAVLLRFSPEAFTPDFVLLLALQLLQAVAEMHARARCHGAVLASNVFVSETGSVRLRRPPRHSRDTAEAASPTQVWALGPEQEDGGALAPSGQRGGRVAEGEELEGHALLSGGDVRGAQQAWREGALSNLDYLLVLNGLVGRRQGDLKFYPIVPWVIDASEDPRPGASRASGSHAGWRDLGKTKYRLAKGDEQLDFTYRMSDVPHHVSDEQLSELTCCIYLARRLPEDLLTSVVRKVFEPNEYPQSFQRLYTWTPDEAIPEFYTDPDVFVSAHEGMRDIELPCWCASPEEFVRAHREALESPRVSAQLHAWIDLAFGYQLSGEAAFNAKNVALPTAARRKNPGGTFCRRGHYQIFRTAHPPRRQGPLRSPAVAAPLEESLEEGRLRLRSLTQGDFGSGALEDWPYLTVRKEPAEPGARLDLESVGGLILAMCTRHPWDIISADISRRNLQVKPSSGGLNSCDALPAKTRALIQACFDGSASAADLVGSDAFEGFHFDTLELVCRAGGEGGCLAELRSVADYLRSYHLSTETARLSFHALSRIVLDSIKSTKGEVTSCQVSSHAAVVIDHCINQSVQGDPSLRDFLLELIRLGIDLPSSSFSVQEMLFEETRWASIYGCLGEALYYRSVQPKLFSLIGQAGSDRLTRLLVKAVVRICQGVPLPEVLYQCLRPGLASMAVNEKICVLLVSLYNDIPNAGLRRLIIQELVDILSVPPVLMKRATGSFEQRQSLKARSRAMLGALVALDHLLQVLDPTSIKLLILGQEAGSDQGYCDLLTLLMTPFPDLQVVCRAALLLIRATDTVGGAKAVLADVLPEVRTLVFVSTTERDLFDELEVTQKDVEEPEEDAAVVIPEGHKYLLSVVYHGLAIVVGIEELHAALPIWAEIESYIAETTGEAVLPWEERLIADGAAKQEKSGWAWLCSSQEPYGLDFGDLLLKTGSTASVAQSVRDRPWTIQASVEHYWKAHTQRLSALAVRGGGNVLLTSGRDASGNGGGSRGGGDTVKVWDWATSSCCREYFQHQDRVVGMHFLSSGSRAASCDSSALHIWKVETCEQLAMFPLLHNSTGTSLLPQASSVSLSSSLKRSQNVSPRSSASPLPPSLNEVSPAGQPVMVASEFTCCAVEPVEMQRLVAGTSDGFLQEFDIHSGKRLSLWRVGRELRGMAANRVLSTAIQPVGGTTVACGLASGVACALDSRTGLPVFRLQTHGGSITAIAWHGNSHVLTGGADRMMSLWDCRMLRRDRDSQCVQTFQGHRDTLGGFSLCGGDVLSYAGSRIAVGTLFAVGAHASPVSLDPVRVRSEKDSHDGRICAAVLLPAWHHFVLGTEDGAVKVCS